jgi:Holliday junction resolvase-like predicted endonuclease
MSPSSAPPPPVLYSGRLDCLHQDLVNRVGKGNATELLVATDLESKGWVVGMRRHRKGGGDLIAVHPDVTRVRVIEVKGNAGSPYEHFRPTERTALSRVAAYLAADALLAHVQRGRINWYPEEHWPAARV